MSNFERLTEHPETGEMKSASWLDDYFGKHKYGVKFKGEDKIYKESEIQAYRVELSNNK